MAGNSSSGGDDYETWTWQQIKQAILGSADISTADEENQLASVSDPKSFYTAADKLQFAGSTFSEVREFLSNGINRLLGPAGSWSGDAAETLNGIAQQLLKSIDDYVSPVANDGYRNPIDTAATNLNGAIQKVREADKKAAQATVNKYKDDPNPSTADVPWRAEGSTTIVDVSKYPEIEQELTQTLRGIIKDLAGAYQNSTADLREPVQHAFVKDGKIVDTPNTTWIGSADDAPGAVTTTARQDTTPASSSDKSSDKPSDEPPDEKPPTTGKSADNPSGSDSHDDSSSSYSGKGDSSYKDVPDTSGSSYPDTPKSGSHSHVDTPQFDTPQFDNVVSSNSNQQPPTPDFNGDTTSANNPHQNAFLYSPSWNGPSAYAPPGSGYTAKRSINSPDLKGLEDDYGFAPETHVESYDPNSLLGAPPPGGRIETPRFGDKRLNVPEFENAVVPEDAIPTTPIGNSLLSAVDAKGRPTDFRSGNPPPPKLSNVRGFSGEDGFLSADGHLMPGQGGQHSYRGNGFLTEEEMTSALGGRPGGGFPGGYPGAGENPLGTRGGMPMGGAGMPFREEEHGHGQHSWLREDDDVWEQEKKDDKPKDGPRGRR